MGARFEGHEHRRHLARQTCCGQCVDFGVRSSQLQMGSLPDDAVVADDDGADKWVRAHSAEPAARETQRPPHVITIL